jgi:hypothetical protein
LGLDVDLELKVASAMVYREEVDCMQELREVDEEVVVVVIPSLSCPCRGDWATLRFFLLAVNLSP